MPQDRRQCIISGPLCSCARFKIPRDPITRLQPTLTAKLLGAAGKSVEVLTGRLQNQFPQQQEAASEGLCAYGYAKEEVLEALFARSGDEEAAFDLLHAHLTGVLHSKKHELTQADGQLVNV